MNAKTKHTTGGGCCVQHPTSVMRESCQFAARSSASLRRRLHLSVIYLHSTGFNADERTAQMRASCPFQVPKRPAGEQHLGETTFGCTSRVTSPSDFQSSFPRTKPHFSDSPAVTSSAMFHRVERVQADLDLPRYLSRSSSLAVANNR